MLNKNIIKALPIPIILVDNDLEILFMNGKFKHLFCSSEKDIKKGAKLNDILHQYSDFINLIKDKIVSIKKKEKFFAYIETEIYEVHLIKIEENKIVLVLDDITPNKKIIDIRKKFIIDVSHELRTPIAAASSLVETIAYTDNLSEDKVKEYSRIVYDELQRLSILITELFEISKYDYKMRTLSYSKFKVNDLIKELNILYSLVEKENPRDIKIRFDIEDNLELTADYNKLKQVLINIIENAFIYAKETIIIKAYKKNENIFIEVIDDGIGLTQEQMNKVFLRFYRADMSRKRTSGGSGIGLSICKEIVELHGGKIYVQSKKGSGAKFIIRLKENNE